MLLTIQEIKKLVKAKGMTTPDSFEDAVQEASLAAWKAEKEQPDDKKHAINRAITAARNYTRAERIRARNLGSSILTVRQPGVHGKAAIEVASSFVLLDKDMDEATKERQRQALQSFLAQQDEKTRAVITRYLAGEKMRQIAARLLMSLSTVSRIIAGFKERGAAQIGKVE